MRMKKDMHENLRAWLRQKLAERGRGSRAELAAYIGATNNTISKMITPQKLQGYRIITATELVKMTEFFGETPPGFEMPSNLKAPPSEQKSISAVDRDFYELLSSLSLEGKENLLAFLKTLISTNPKPRSSAQVKEKKKGK